MRLPESIYCPVCTRVHYYVPIPFTGLWILYVCGYWAELEDRVVEEDDLPH